MPTAALWSSLGRMLNDGQARKSRITAEGEAIFADLTGPKHEKELYHLPMIWWTLG